MAVLIAAHAPDRTLVDLTRHCAELNRAAIE